MSTTIVPIPTKLIVDWDSFHAVFVEVLGFPEYYGRNMNAWIDCLTYADDPKALMLEKELQPGDMLTLRIDDASDFAARLPEQYTALVECAAFVNSGRVERGDKPVLSLVMSG